MKLRKQPQSGTRYYGVETFYGRRRLTRFMTREEAMAYAEKEVDWLLDQKRRYRRAMPGEIPRKYFTMGIIIFERLIERRQYGWWIPTQMRVRVYYYFNM